MKSQLPIGVFDSGMGGLTVLRALQAALPAESFIYLGDTARLPYGTKSPDTVRQYAIQMARVLMQQHIKALVIACNTATTAALSYLQQILTDIPVLGVVSPGALAAVSSTRNQHVLVLATETTIAANAYQALIQAQLPNARIRARACSVLVALAEEGMVDNAVATAALMHYLQGMTTEDTVLLGCTHFPVFKPLLTRLLPAKTRIVDSAEATAVALKQILTDRNLHRMPTQTCPARRYLVTDSIARFQIVGELFLGQPLHRDHIELIDVKS
jgi:glutamate racemase